MKQVVSERGITHLLKEDKQPQTVAQMVEKLRVNKTTVYRRLEKMVADGTIVEIYLSDGKKRYELAKIGHHHHTMCDNCHKIECVEIEPDVVVLDKEIKLKLGFWIKRHKLDFFGLCARCK